MAEQTISPLTKEDRAKLEEQRSVITRYLSDDSQAKYEHAAGKLGLLRALLEANTFNADQTYELQCMGIVLGDVFAQDMGLAWVMVSDEYGRDPAVRYKDTTIMAFPLTMISKRIEQGDTVDIFELYNGVAAEIGRLIAEGYQ